MKHIERGDAESVSIVQFTPDLMPATRRRSAKSAAVAPVIKSSSAQVKVAKYSQNDEIKKVTETPTAETPESTTERRFAPTRPVEPKISLEEYVSDFKVRMLINNYEVMEFLEDCKKFYNAVSPHMVKAFNYSKEKIEEWTATPTVEKTEGAE